MAYDGRNYDVPTGLQLASTGCLGRSAPTKGITQTGPSTCNRPGMNMTGTRYGYPASDMKTCDPLQPMAPLTTSRTMVFVHTGA
jgi:hypothetical protein